VFEKIPGMTDTELKGVLIGLANRKNVGSLMEKKQKQKNPVELEEVTAGAVGN
jgi:hypothetical protein